MVIYADLIRGSIEKVKTGVGVTADLLGCGFDGLLHQVNEIRGTQFAQSLEIFCTNIYDRGRIILKDPTMLSSVGRNEGLGIGHDQLGDSCLDHLGLLCGSMTRFRKEEGRRQAGKKLKEQLEYKRRTFPTRQKLLSLSSVPDAPSPSKRQDPRGLHAHPLVQAPVPS